MATRTTKSGTRGRLAVLIRGLVVGAALLWLLATGWVWSGRPPLVTVVAESRSNRLQVMGFDGDGNIAVAVGPPVAQRSRGRSSIAKAVPVHGPLTLHSPTGETLSTLLAEDEAIQKVRMDLGLVVSRISGFARLRSFGRMKPLVEAPIESEKAQVTISPEGSRLLVVTGGAASVYDCRDGTAVWSKPGVSTAIWAGDDWVHLQMSEDGAPEALANAGSGEVVRGTGKAFPKPHEGERSPDGRLAWWAVPRDAEDPPGLYDTVTGQRLWGLEHASVSRISAEQSRYFFFSDDSTELCVLYDAGSDLFRIARWRARDAEPIHGLPRDALLLVNEYQGTKAISEDGRWRSTSIRRPGRASGWIPRSVLQSLLMRAPSVYVKLLPLVSTSSFTRITEIPTGQIVAETPQLGPDVVVEPGDKAFLFHGGPKVTRVDLPPRTDYGWLVRYGILPPAVLIGLWEVWRWRRRGVAERDQGAAVVQSG
ncbi:hypothetical protein Pan44_13310 [Caulifigura coniformis]|uniref:Uncharacterized protein n=1 Tax=Caulifigura coniformis TaxID=2527983 RepID=A0A517SB27_9PLAN|nr:hypothetical protein [Caulifigura coniformis]QDT53315.1 hypothetical protein Pan44_13310 [Caulifigura coniformis]